MIFLNGRAAHHSAWSHGDKNAHIEKSAHIVNLFHSPFGWLAYTVLFHSKMRELLFVDLLKMNLLFHIKSYNNKNSRNDWQRHKIDDMSHTGQPFIVKPKGTNESLSSSRWKNIDRKLNWHRFLSSLGSRLVLLLLLMLLLLVEKTTTTMTPLSSSTANERMNKKINNKIAVSVKVVKDNKQKRVKSSGRIKFSASHMCLSRRFVRNIYEKNHHAAQPIENDNEKNTIHQFNHKNAQAQYNGKVHTKFVKILFFSFFFFFFSSSLLLYIAHRRHCRYGCCRRCHRRCCHRRRHSRRQHFLFSSSSQLCVYLCFQNKTCSINCDNWQWLRFSISRKICPGFQ